jgi:membrane protein implicated in regulation of membrane protease activity
MELYLLWIIAGIALVIAEMLTGTFYLLVVGAGAFVAAVVAWLGLNVIFQSIVGGIVAIGGTLFVHHWHEARRNRDAGRSNFLDRGQAVVLEGWSNENAGIARVKYRGTSWDARVDDPLARPVPGSTLYIEGQEGNMLLVAAAPPAR